MSQPERPDISLIIVFHNAEATIERTLRSLAAQTLPTVEYVFVDDGSTDRSVDVIRSFLALNQDFDGRHRLVQVATRRGSAHATTLGYAHATGEYVMRCDADDYLEPDALEQMLTASDGKRLDVVIAPFKVDNGRSQRETGFKRLPESLNDMKIDTLNFALWNKLLRRKLLDEHGITPYDGIDCWEDLGVVARVMALKPAVGFADKAVYNYVVEPNGQSLSRSGRGRILEDHLVTALLVEQWMNRRGLQDENKEFLNHLKFCAKVKMLRGRDKDVARWKNTFPEVNSRIMGLRHIALHWRLIFALVAAMPTTLTQWIADRCDIFYRSERAGIRPSPGCPKGCAVEKKQ